MSATDLKICTPGSGMEFEGWAATWCNRCLHDHGLHLSMKNEPIEGSGFEPFGCPLVARAMLEDPKAPTVWQRYRYTTEAGEPRGGVRCAGFEPCEPCGRDVALRPPVYGEDL